MVNYLIQGQSRWGQILVPVNDISVVQSDLGTVSKKGIAARKNIKMFATNVLFEVSDVQLKTLSDKSREAKVKSKPRTVPCSPKYSAGLELLSRYVGCTSQKSQGMCKCWRGKELANLILCGAQIYTSCTTENERTTVYKINEQCSLSKAWCHLSSSAEACPGEVMWSSLQCGLESSGEVCEPGDALVDSEVVMLSAHWEKKRTSLVELQEQLQQLPGLLADLESMTANLTHLEASFEEVENHLLNLEDLCGQCELERYKHMQSQQLENYKKNKRACGVGGAAITGVKKETEVQEVRTSIRAMVSEMTSKLSERSSRPERSDLYFSFLKVGGGGGRLGKSVAHRPGFAENRTEGTYRVNIVLQPEEKVQSTSSKELGRKHSWWILEKGQAERCLAACPTCSLCGQWPEKSGERQQQEREGATCSSWAACSRMVTLAPFLCGLSSYLHSAISSLRPGSEKWHCRCFKGHWVISYWRGLILDFKEGHSPPKSLFDLENQLPSGHPYLDISMDVSRAAYPKLCSTATLDLFLSQ
ncbi:hypothetical protein GH733_016724 [Mirounga leonina]|nr:hypothetical protein GH733_016724 [Mirounga leonina]